MATTPVRWECIEMTKDVLIMSSDLFFTGGSQVRWSSSVLLVNRDREGLKSFI